MINWTIRQDGFDSQMIVDNGNRFLLGNGYMGIRGTLDEFGKEQLAAINLSGIYDKVGDGWREPLNAPNPVFTTLEADGKKYILPDEKSEDHSLCLDYRKAVLTRETVWNTSQGKITLNSERFVSMDEFHLVAVKYSLSVGYTCEIVIETGIDGDVWDINGPHYTELFLNYDEELMSIEGITNEAQEKVYVASGNNIDFECDSEILADGKKILKCYSFTAVPDKLYSITKYAAVYTSRDTDEYKGAADNLVKKCLKGSYRQVKSAHTEKWEEIWNVSEVEIEGDDTAMEAINYSMYHLHSIAPRHTDSLSIPARGLSGQTYKGAVFWDTEMFMLDLFINTSPEVAKTLINYRIKTLEGALKKAKEYGYDGAFYAWESQEGGFDACSDYNVTDVFTGRPMRTYFRDKQIHISSAVVYGIMKYYERCADEQILKNGGAKVIIECGKFYYSCLTKRLVNDYYDLLDVIGPDEYHERVDNNGYTNRMAKYTFDCCTFVLENVDSPDIEEYKTEGLLEKFKDASEHIFIPQPDEDGIIPQFDGYEDLEDTTVEEVKKRLLNEKEYWGGAYGVASETKIAKQADVVAWLGLFPEDFNKEIIKKNWIYYNNRTEHGSSLSASMFAKLACFLGFKKEAYSYFMKSATSDIRGGGKQWAGLIYIGGTHPAAAGGAYIDLVYGFAGVLYKNGEIVLSPSLPDSWTGLKFRLFYANDLYEINIKGNQKSVKKIGLQL